MKIIEQLAQVARRSVSAPKDANEELPKELDRSTADLVNRRLINSLYQTVLQRDADEVGLSSNAGLLEASDRDDAMVRVLAGLVHSPEFHQKASRNPAVQKQYVAPEGGRRINGKPVRHVASLGTHCLTSFLLKKHGLKHYSLPFDWLFSSPDAIMHCIDDNFTEFLDRSHYTSRTEHRETKEPGADHLFYLKHFGVGDMFAHRDPLTDPDYRYVVDTVRRFHALINCDDPKLFVMICRPGMNLVEKFELVASKVLGMTPNAEFISVQLKEPTLEIGCHSMIKLKELRGATLYEFTPSSEENGRDFREAIDDAAIMRLIWAYSLELAPAITLQAVNASDPRNEPSSTVV